MSLTLPGRRPRTASPLDRSLGGPPRVKTAPLLDRVDPEPDLSARYRVPARAAESVDQDGAVQALMDALRGLEVGAEQDRAVHRLLVWTEQWSSVDQAALAALLQAARAAGGAR